MAPASTMLQALEAERLASVHMTARRFDAAHSSYVRAAVLWHGKADRAARYGETAISDGFRDEARKNEARANRALGFLMVPA